MQDFIVHEDNNILVALKPVNFSLKKSEDEGSFFNKVRKYLVSNKENGTQDPYLKVFNSIDKPAGGLVLFCKNSKSFNRLSGIESVFESKNLAVVIGEPKHKKAVLKSYLKKDSSNNKLEIVPSGEEGAEKAEISYKLLQGNQKISLIEVESKNNANYQIRAQLYNNRTPVFGDVTYGGDIVKGWNLALWTYKIRFYHPVTKVLMTFMSYPPSEDVPWNHFKLDKHLKINI